MIVVKIQGGLGNQLFQFALGYSLSNTYGNEILYDFSYFRKEDEKVTSWPYELNKFGIVLPKNWLFNQKIYQIGNKLGIRKFTIYKEKEIDNPDLILQVKNGYLDGYWQNLVYFHQVSQEIIEKIKFGIKLNAINKEWQKKISAQKSVSVHIRRGDYLNQGVDKFLIDPLKYYTKAFNIIHDTIKDPKFYFFSDDLKWVKEKLGKLTDNAVYMDINSGENSYQDMILMSHCKHNIIANSSFSWWGAFLNTNSDKKVIAPKNWIFKGTNNLNRLDWVAL